MPFPQVSYPRDASGFVRQCAWCRRVADTGGQYRLPSSALLLEGTSHGCCVSCAAMLVLNVRQSARTAHGAAA